MAINLCLAVQVISYVVLSVLVIKLVLWITQNVTSRLKHTKLLKEFKGPTPHWFFGNVQQTKRGYGILRVMEWKAEYGPAFIIHVGPIMRAIVVTSPEFIQPILQRSDPKDSNYAMFSSWIGDGLLVSSGEKWKRNRRLLTPAFHFGILKPYQTLFSQSANNMIEKWKKLVHVKPEESVEMYQHISLMTLNSLMKCIFGINSDFNEHENGQSHPYIRVIYIITELLSKRMRSIFHRNDFIYSLSANSHELKKALSIAHAFTESVIEERHKEKCAGGQNRCCRKYQDFLDMLLDCRDEDGNGLSPQEIQDEVDTFMFEGHDTTASAISWCLYNLASHKDCQSKCRAEVKLVLGGKKEVSWDDTYNLRYLTMCIRESLRTHPPVPSIGRCLTEPVQLPDGKTIPAGTWTILSILACHMDPQIWTDPEKFDPERFKCETKCKLHSHAFIPFSAGARNCIGQHFAMNELKTALALILQNFELDIDDTKPAEKFTQMVMRSANGIWLKLTPLSNGF